MASLASRTPSARLLLSPLESPHQSTLVERLVVVRGASRRSRLRCRTTAVRPPSSRPTLLAPKRCQDQPLPPLSATLSPRGGHRRRSPRPTTVRQPRSPTASSLDLRLARHLPLSPTSVLPLLHIPNLPLHPQCRLSRPRLSYKKPAPRTQPPLASFKSPTPSQPRR